jgi:hypothetical protein
MDLTLPKQNVARALHSVEAAIRRLIEALTHRETWVSVAGVASDRDALERICTAYASIDYGNDDDANVSIVCLGVIGVSADVLERAVAVNAAKAELRTVCAPLSRITMRVPVKGEDGPTKPLPVIRVILRNLQRSDLNLLAAYRKIPVLGAPPATITYTRARTRAVYRKTVDEIYNLLAPMEGPGAGTDRARLETLPPDERYLAVVKAHYDNIRANITYSRLDARGRGRVQLAAELPLLYAAGRKLIAPVVNYPASAAEIDGSSRRRRKSEIEQEPFLQSIPAYRYLRSAAPFK